MTGLMKIGVLGTVSMFVSSLMLLPGCGAQNLGQPGQSLSAVQTTDGSGTARDDDDNNDNDDNDDDDNDDNDDDDNDDNSDDDDDGEGELDVSPSEVNFEDACAGGISTEEVTIRNEGEGELRITSISTSGGGFSIVNKPSLPMTLDEGERLTLTVQLEADDNDDDIEGSLRIKSEDETIEVDLTGNLTEPELRISPDEVDFGDIDAATEYCAVYEEVKVRNSSQCDVRITDVQLDGDNAGSVEIVGDTERTIASGETMTVYLLWDCSEGEDLDAELTFEDASGGTPATIEVHGNAN